MRPENTSGKTKERKTLLLPCRSLVELLSLLMLVPVEGPRPPNVGVIPPVVPPGVVVPPVVPPGVVVPPEVPPGVVAGVVPPPVVGVVLELADEG